MIPFQSLDVAIVVVVQPNAAVAAVKSRYL